MRTRLPLIGAALLGVVVYIFARFAYEGSTALLQTDLTPGLAAIVPAPLYLGLALAGATIAGGLVGLPILRSAFAPDAAARRLLLGSLLGLLLVGLVFGAAAALGWLRTGPGAMHPLTLLRGVAGGVLIAATIAVVEELIFRGVVLSLLARAWNWRVGILLSAAVFTAVHYRGPGTGAAYLVGIFALGLLEGIAYMATRSVWLPIGIHIGWDLAQAVLTLGRDAGLLVLQADGGAARLVGTVDQAEAGLLGIVLLLLASLALLVLRPARPQGAAAVAVRAMPSLPE